MKDELKKLQTVILDGDLTEAVRLCDEVMAMAEKSPWQPIETAPKDGSHILVSNGRLVEKAYFDSDLSKWCDAWDGDEEFHDLLRLTHWIPPPPKP